MKIIFHPFAEKAPVNGFSQIWNQPSTRLLNHSWQTVSMCSRVSILREVKFSICPIGNWRRRKNGDAVPRSLCNIMSFGL